MSLIGHSQQQMLGSNQISSQFARCFLRISQRTKRLFIQLFSVVHNTPSRLQKVSYNSFFSHFTCFTLHLDFSDNFEK